MMVGLGEIDRETFVTYALFYPEEHAKIVETFPELAVTKEELYLVSSGADLGGVRVSGMTYEPLAFYGYEAAEGRAMEALEHVHRSRDGILKSQFLSPLPPQDWEKDNERLKRAATLILDVVLGNCRPPKRERRWGNGL